MHRYRSIALLAAGLLAIWLGASAHPAAARSIDRADPFAQGSMRFSLMYGNGEVHADDQYGIVGAGVGYYVQDNLEFGLDAERWFGGELNIYKAGPQIRYVFQSAASVRPYAGLFYTHTFIEGVKDYETVGGRAGLYFHSERRSYFGVGVAHRVGLNCDDRFTTCTDSTLELLLAISF